MQVLGNNAVSITLWYIRDRGRDREHVSIICRDFSILAIRDVNNVVVDQLVYCVLPLSSLVVCACRNESHAPLAPKFDSFEWRDLRERVLGLSLGGFPTIGCRLFQLSNDDFRQALESPVQAVSGHS